jgi:hypothetical protein
MNDEIKDAIDNFYRLKQEYHNNVISEQKKIMKNKTLTKQQKKLRLRDIKGKCVNCGSSKGTIFSQTEGTLKARCGNVEKPCNLNIEIYRGIYNNLTEVSLLIENELQELKTKIITAKLDLLFGYQDEATAIGKFESYRQELKIIESMKIEFEIKFNNIIRGKKKSEAIKALENDLYTEKETLKALSRRYDETKETSLLSDMVELYVNDIKKINKSLRKIKYSYNAVECETDECKTDERFLLQEPFNYQDLQVTVSGQQPDIKINVN